MRIPVVGNAYVVTGPNNETIPNQVYFFVFFFLKWIWPGNATITDHLPTHDRVRKRYKTQTTTQQHKHNKNKEPALSSSARVLQN